MQRSRLLLALAVAFGAMTLTLAASGLAFNLAILAPAALFGVVTYVLWAHGTGRLVEHIYHRVERRAATGTRASRQEGSPGANRQRRARDSGRRPGRERATRDRVDQDGTGARRRRQQVGSRTRSQRSPIARRNARAILGVESGADQPTVKRAYRQRVKEVHPDTADGDLEQFKRVQTAYETLRE